jgi:hypothetical protein
MNRLGLFLLVTTALGLGCSNGDSSTDDDDDSAAVTTSRVPDKAAFFGGDLYYVRVTKWDSNKMTPAALRDEQKVGGAELSIFAANPESNVHCPDAEATDRDLVFKTGGFSLRTSGNLTNGTPKSSYKVGLEDKRDRFFGMSALNLKAMWNDVSQMREALAWRLFGEAGIRAPRHTYAKLCINGHYYGLYSLIEQVDGAFLKERFGDNDKGNLYKMYWQTRDGRDLDIGPASLEVRRDRSGDDSGKQYWKTNIEDDRTYQLKTNDKSSDPKELQTLDDLADFIRTLNRAKEANPSFDTPEYAADMEAAFDVKGYLRWASVNSLLGAWDNYYATPGNYYLYNAGRRGQATAFMQKPYWSWIPWDYDNSFGIDFFNAKWQYANIVDWPSATRPYYQGKSVAKLPLLTNLLANTKFLRYYLDSIEYLNDTVFNEAWLTKTIGDEHTGLRHRIQASVFLESDSPSGVPHTGRQWTNDEVFRSGFQHNEIQRGGEHIDGILHYVRMRHDSVVQQLAELRHQHPKGSSGATFPARPTDIP